MDCVLKKRQIIIGSMCWLAAVAVGGYFLRAELGNQSSSLSDLTHSVGQWLTHSNKETVATSEMMLSVGLDDPIFVATNDGRFVQAGHVSNVDDTRSRDPKPVQQVRIVIYDSAIDQFPEGYYLEYHTTPMNLDWVVRMLIPPERQQQIGDLIQKEWSLHQEVVLREFKPVINDGLRRVVKSVEAELPQIIERHRDDFRALGDRFEADILQEELLPLAKDEILPVIQEELQPLALEIANALWNRVSLVSFTWRYLYDVSPLPQRNALRSEFQRFVDEEAIPELESRTDEFVEVTKVVIKRVLENERVRSTFSDSVERMVEDPDLQRIVWDIIRESSVENPVLRKELKAWMASYRKQAAVRLASGRLETMVRAIGDLIMGTREGGVTPEFARILRSQVLRKDRRWFVMVPNSDSERQPSVEIRRAASPMLFPQKFAGQHQSPLTPE